MSDLALGTLITFLALVSISNICAGFALYAGYEYGSVDDEIFISLSQA